MFGQVSVAPAELPDDHPPVLIVIVDTEEEFDWSRPLSRSNTQIDSLDAQRHAQDVFDKYGLAPAYVIDYPVAESTTAAKLFGEWYRDGRCEIGAHLHPWVNPPHEEEVTPRNSYACNLPADLERAKLECLTETIESNLGLRPKVFRAGRFGFGAETARILEDLGYDVDVSVVPDTSFAEDGGPNFRGLGVRPFWFGEHRRLLEIPVSCAYVGALSRWGHRLYPLLATPLGMGLQAPGIAARSGLVERIRLTPEGIDYAAQRRLVRTMMAQGCKVFSLTYHSPSLEPGNTPYVCDDVDLRDFLRTLDDFLRYFFHDLQGQPTTPTALYGRMIGNE